MNKEEAYKKLSDKLTSHVWGNLKTSLLGKELLSFGAELISEVSQVASDLKDVFFIETCPKKYLYACAWINELKLDTIKPFTIKVKLDSSVLKKSFNKTIYGPFEIKIQVGAALYYNIDFVNVNNDMILYQGEPYRAKDIENLETGIYSEDFINFAWEKSDTVMDSEGLSSTRVKLTKNTITDSVRVFTNDGGVTPCTEYSELYYTGTGLYNTYKIRVNEEDIQYVVFGDGSWGKKLNPDTNIMWLNATFVKVSEQSSVKVFIQNKYIPSDGLFLNKQFTIGDENPSLDYLRTQLRGQLAKTTSVSNKQQLRMFVNSLPTVLDSYPLVTDSNEVTVYIKPTNSGDKTFGFISYLLGLYGDICVNYKTKVAGSYKFSVKIKEPSVFTEAQRNQVINRLQEKFAYDNIGFETQVTASSIAAMIKDLIDSTTIEVILQESLNAGTQDVQLMFTPSPTSIKILNNETKQVEGWDSVGELMVMGDSSETYGNTTISVGDFSIDSAFRFAINKNTGSYTNITNQFSGIQSAVISVSSEVPYLCIGTGTKNYMMQFLNTKDYLYLGVKDDSYCILKVAKGSGFIDGDLSIERLTGLTRSVQKFKLAESLDMCCATAVAVDNDVYYVTQGNVINKIDKTVIEKIWFNQRLKTETSSDFFIGSLCRYAMIDEIPSEVKNRLTSLGKFEVKDPEMQQLQVISSSYLSWDALMSLLKSKVSTTTAVVDPNWSEASNANLKILMPLYPLTQGAAFWVILDLSNKKSEIITELSNWTSGESTVLHTSVTDALKSVLESIKVDHSPSIGNNFTIYYVKKTTKYSIFKIGTLNLKSSGIKLDKDSIKSLDNDVTLTVANYYNIKELEREVESHVWESGTITTYANYNYDGIYPQTLIELGTLSSVVTQKTTKGQMNLIKFTQNESSYLRVEGFAFLLKDLGGNSWGNYQRRALIDLGKHLLVAIYSTIGNEGLSLFVIQNYKTNPVKVEPIIASYSEDVDPVTTLFSWQCLHDKESEAILFFTMNDNNSAFVLKTLRYPEYDESQGILLFDDGVLTMEYQIPISEMTNPQFTGGSLIYIKDSKELVTLDVTDRTAKPKVICEINAKVKTPRSKGTIDYENAVLKLNGAFTMQKLIEYQILTSQTEKKVVKYPEFDKVIWE